MKTTVFETREKKYGPDRAREERACGGRPLAGRAACAPLRRSISQAFLHFLSCFGDDFERVSVYTAFGSHADYIWKSSGLQLEVIWTAPGSHLDYIRTSSGLHLEIIWTTSGCHVDFIWKSF